MTFRPPLAPSLSVLVTQGAAERFRVPPAWSAICANYGRRRISALNVRNIYVRRLPWFRDAVREVLWSWHTVRCNRYPSVGCAPYKKIVSRPIIYSRVARRRCWYLDACREGKILLERFLTIQGVKWYPTAVDCWRGFDALQSEASSSLNCFEQVKFTSRVSLETRHRCVACIINFGATLDRILASWRTDKEISGVSLPGEIPAKLEKMPIARWPNTDAKVGRQLG